MREEARAEMLREPLDFFCSERVSAVSQVRPVLKRILGSKGCSSLKSQCSMSESSKDGHTWSSTAQHSCMPWVEEQDYTRRSW